MGSNEGTDPHSSEEEEPLVVSVDGAPSSSVVRTPPRKHTRDLHILSFAFLFVFSAYGAAQNLESTVNNEGNIGTISLAILYLSFTLFSIIASPVVRVLGSKRALVLGTSGYLLFIAANLSPSWYTMVPASVYLGFTASIIWVGEGTYLTTAALCHAEDNNLHEGTVIGAFNGEFWSMFASHQVIGNLLSLALLRNGEGDDVTGKNLLFTVFLVCMIIGIVMMCFLSKRDEKKHDKPTCTSLGSLLKSSFAPLLDKRMLLVIPLIAYSGLQQAFVWAEYTEKIVTPALGISGVGGSMAVYGAADAICSLVAGRLTSGLHSITWIVSIGAFLQAFVLLWLLFGYRLTSGLMGMVNPLLMGAIWGVGDGVFNTQLSALLGLLFKDNKEAAFAQLKVWQCAAIAVIFFIYPYISLNFMLVLMLVELIISISSFLLLTLVLVRPTSAGILNPSS
ncbi:UNC93-like protein 3 [Carex littledalei]|uniref:UNC93-like protein 3 n=1 Tax=Carex littledalei TaxID=544730 RepID=A0A833QXM6_9POAL|nr:UNC93-like protein 3 [Carex littledalei]